VSGLYNVGSGKARSFKDLAIATFEAVGVPPRISFTDMPEGLKNKYQYFTEADISKLRAAGYSRPMTEIEDGVRSLVQKFLTQDDPYR
jgi:ADP-L-glycero-D-manno-heptose 6-epimerase